MLFPLCVPSVLQKKKKFFVRFFTVDNLTQFRDAIYVRRGLNGFQVFKFLQQKAGQLGLYYFWQSCPSTVLFESIIFSTILIMCPRVTNYIRHTRQRSPFLTFFKNIIIFCRDDNVRRLRNSPTKKPSART